MKEKELKDTIERMTFAILGLGFGFQLHKIFKGILSKPTTYNLSWLYED